MGKQILVTFPPNTERKPTPPPNPEFQYPAQLIAYYARELSTAHDLDEALSLIRTIQRVLSTYKFVIESRESNGWGQEPQPTAGKGGV